MMTGLPVTVENVDLLESITLPDGLIYCYYYYYKHGCYSHSQYTEIWVHRRYTWWYHVATTGLAQYFFLLPLCGSLFSLLALFPFSLLLL